MTPLTRASFSSSTRLDLKLPLFPLPSPPTTFLSSLYTLKPRSQKKKRIRNRTCRAEFAHDAPFAAAIGACMLSSLVFPDTGNAPDSDGDSGFDLADTRFSVMGIISFVPYFNWLSWVFAWLDSGNRRYAVYAVVYLAPYLRSNLSLSPEESWLPIASIVLCIIHIQLEASIKNGDIQGFQLFSKAANHLSSMGRKKDHSKGHEGISEEGRKEENINLPSADKQSRNEIRRWGVPKKPSEDREPSNEDWLDDERNH
ncbi:uncharacterized protein LOC132181248 [Corylus avellana]|uniref:uncharacterized protein LOC132181248 n=1 Tax=Corylus avellana TaxID=13451 RepID=UPI001E226B8A|nr:uncharacterized protein LOC132181248 [Corylus avellana]